MGCFNFISCCCEDNIFFCRDFCMYSCNFSSYCYWGMGIYEN